MSDENNITKIGSFTPPAGVICGECEKRDKVRIIRVPSYMYRGEKRSLGVAGKCILYKKIIHGAEPNRLQKCSECQDACGITYEDISNFDFGISQVPYKTVAKQNTTTVVQDVIQHPKK